MWDKSAQLSCRSKRPRLVGTSTVREVLDQRAMSRAELREFLEPKFAELADFLRNQPG